MRAEKKSHMLEEELTLCKLRDELAQKEIKKAREEIMGLRAQVGKLRWGATKAREELEATADGKWPGLGI
ncbi:hypothetical protein GYMLUDRAFT_49546 [Collybiopsis luxurians FD-317 M1]|uniref:Uncharacterized protein n=1 Tax=Collybiopsis luxurians FD-317 M1 TaxID=944289 RepID=A0A0D0C5T6_9AGAR|nr:hypothetical protein GYMLUDRAFT_49546 [Collybiopsis luxurians FD-317 M1]